MGTIELKKRKFSRFPIIFFIVTSPLLFILSFRVAFASLPTAHDDAYGTSEDTTLVITAPGVLGNDDDVDNGEAFLETAPLSGTVELSASGAFTYTPLLDFNGIITFSYYVSQTGSISDVANVVITVTAVNDPPLASSDNATTPEDTAVSIPVLANDNDVDGSLVPSSLTLISEPVSGTTSINPTNGTIIYTPTLNFNGSDSLIYQVFDNGTPTPTLPVTATVYLTVTAVNDAPTATNDSSTTTEDTAIYISQPGVLSNDNDVDSGDTITVADFDGTSSKGAVVSVSANGGYTYNPTDSSVLNALAITETTIDTFSYIISDSGGLTDTAIVTVTVNGSNDAPVIDNSSNMTLANINEDDTVTIGTSVGVIISSAGGDRITDIDAGAVEGIAVVGATNINGIWQYSISDGSSWNSFGGLSDFNAVLLDITEYIRFVPNADYNGSAGTINFRAWDQTAGSSGNINVNVAANGGTTPFSADVETATLTVLSVNDAPVLDNSGAMYLTSIGEDNTTNPGDSVAAIVASPGGNRITDVDVGDEEGIAVIDVDNSHGIWQYSTNGGLNWASFFVSPTSATLLDSQSRIRFVPQANYFGNAGNITFRAWDLTSGIVGDTGANVSQNGGITAFSTVTETAALNVFSINDKPFLDLNGGGSGNTGFGASFTEDGGAVRIVDTDLSIEDVDDTNLESAQAILTNLLDDTAESLVVDTGTTEITAVYSSTTGILSLTGSASLANYQTVLRTLSYNNTSQDPNTDGRVVEVTVNDGSDNSNLTTSFVSINADNDYPILENNVTLPVNEGGTVTISVSRLQVTDIDNTPLEIIYTVITPPSHGDLLLSSSPLTTNDTFTQADIDNSNLDYDHDASEFTSDSFTFTVSDSSGGTIGVTTFHISVNAENDSPLLAINVGLNLDEHSTSTISSTLLAVTDVDNTAVQLTYRLEVAPENGNLLLNGTPLLTNDTFTQANIDNTKLAYTHNGSETISDSFTFAVEDGSGGAIDSTIFAIIINPVNDAPSVDLNGITFGTDFTADFTEDSGPAIIADSASIIFDADTASLQSATATLVNRPDGTAESLSVSTNGTNISASYHPVTGVLSLTGMDTINNFQTVMRTLQYNNASQDPTVTNRTVNVTVNDGSAVSNVAVSTIVIHAVNDLPVLLNNAGLTIDYGQTGIVSNSLLRITDLDNSTSELVYTVKSLPVNGQLKRNGTPLAINSTFTQADIDSGLLAYTHNKTNTESDSFQFTAVDGDGGIISQKTFAIVIHPQPVVYLPAILNNYVYSEPNDTACEAFSVTFNTPYEFLPDDTEDWYKFSIAAPSDLTVQISDYASIDGQMIVYVGSNCLNLTRIKQAADITPGASLTLDGLNAGTYYVRIYTAVLPTNPPPYTLLITKP